MPSKLERLIIEKLGQPQKVITSNGVENWFWKCPFHDDKNPSLCFTPKVDLWYCFGCSKGGGLGAWKYLTRDDNPIDSYFSSPRTPLRTNIVQNSDPPCVEWQSRANEILERSRKFLWSQKGTSIREKLFARGINEETILCWGLGYNPSQFYESAKLWGIREKKSVFVPKGIMIPWRANSNLWKIKVRLERNDPKYLTIKGQENSIYGTWTFHGQKVAFMTEGEFDAMLLHQEVGDIAAVFTLGSASSRKLDAHWITSLLAFQRIFAVGDDDQAGEKLNMWATSISARIKSVKVPRENDITDFWKSGGNIRDWVQETISMQLG